MLWMLFLSQCRHMSTAAAACSQRNLFHISIRLIGLEKVVFTFHFRLNPSPFRYLLMVQDFRCFSIGCGWHVCTWIRPAGWIFNMTCDSKQSTCTKMAETREGSESNEGAEAKADHREGKHPGPIFVLGAWIIDDSDANSHFPPVFYVAYGVTSLGVRSIRKRGSS